MSIAASFANALSGLNAAARGANVISSNVANALTEGYARRELHLSSQALGGVRVDGVTRSLNQAVLSDRRLADAEAGNAGLRSAFLSRVEALLGTPDEDGSLTARYAALEAALIEAASRPDSEARLAGVLSAARDLAAHLNGVSAGIQTARMEADAAIAAEVGTLNESLARIDRLNAEIVRERSSGRDASALMDQRQVLVDRVAEIVPVREAMREDGRIALYTTGGAILLEGNPARIGFTPAGVITADMTQDSGALSGLTLNGTAIRTDETDPMGGGTLTAHFAVRDGLAVSAQTQLDALARDLVARFSDSAADPSLAPGAPGLFTDAGSAFDPAEEAGLAGRIAVNTLADPARGGALWRLRDGLGAAAPGPTGDAARLTALANALAAPRVPASGGFPGAARPAAGLAADVLSRIAGARLGADDAHVHALARQEALTEAHLLDGVDTDRELQALLAVEQAYAANARVLGVLDEMLRHLIGL